MVDEAQAEGWTRIATGWAELWGTLARPAQATLIETARIGPATRVLDIGCGSGEFLAVLRQAGAHAEGVDPSSGMRALASARGFTVHEADAAHLPLPDGSVDVVTAVNALHFADDTDEALNEFARVLAPGGRIAVANWAERERSDLDAIDRAIADTDETEPPLDDPLRAPGGLEAAFEAAGLTVAASGLVDTPWRVPDAETLVRGVLLGEDPATLDELRATVVEAAAPFADGNGGYLLRGAFRWAVGTPDGRAG